jgi:hypothetical protein
VQDYLFVAFFLGHYRGKDARRLLKRCGLLEDAGVGSLGKFHMGVQMRLPAEDPRLQRLLSELHARGEEPIIRLDRVHTKRELDAAEWLVMRTATAGLLGGVDYGQKHDFTRACRTCGAGAVPVAPLLAQLGEMGKKRIDHLVYEHHMIITREVAEGLVGLSGFEIAPVKSPRRLPHEGYAWLKITSSLPAMHPSTTGYEVSDPCPTCGRAGHYAGHFGEMAAPEAPVYSGLPATVSDFNLTYEYFGNWQQLQRNRHDYEPVGGGAGIVVSQQARRRLVELGVRRMVWVPVSVGAV